MRVRLTSGLIASLSHGRSPIGLADVLAHRQLAAAIGHAPLHASLHSKSHVERILDVVNKRHRMAQMAGRASVEFYVGLALKARSARETVIEDAFVIRTFRNGLGVFVSRYVVRPRVRLWGGKRIETLHFRLGIEGLVTFKREIQFDADNYTITVPAGGQQVTISVFDKVKVLVEVEQDKNAPVIMRSASALASALSSKSPSTFAWVKEDLRYEWKHSWMKSSARVGSALSTACMTFDIVAV